MNKQKYLVIPNEHLPNSCHECPCLRHDTVVGWRNGVEDIIYMCQCNLTFKAFDDIPIEKPKDCPLEEVWLDPEAIAYGELKK